MEEKGVSEENSHSLYPMIFGVSCAFFGLRLLPEPHISGENWLDIRNKVLKGSALAGLLVWTVQRNVVTTEKLELLQQLESAQIMAAELKKRRSEDAKANEKVVSIFAEREQSWFDERRKLREQISGLMNELRLVEVQKEKSIAELGEKMKDIEVILHLKDKMIEEAEQRRLDTEVKLKAAEDLAEEMRESVKREVEKHSHEISKHKTAFIELVSNHRHLEAEMGRTLRQVEAAVEEKEQLVLVNQKLSIEMVRMHKDLEEKEQILSAVLRKSKTDIVERQKLVKEVKSFKAKRKQAELETARWKAVSENKHSLRSMFSKQANAKHNHQEIKKGIGFLSFVSDPYLANRTQELNDAKHSRSWEEEIYEMGVEQKHDAEIDAFMEQLRQKDEKLEAYKWRLMTTELESKRLQLHTEALDRDIAHLKQDNARLEGIRLDREAKLQTLQQQMMTMHFLPPTPHKMNFNSSPHEAVIVEDTAWSRVKIVKTKPRQEVKGIDEEKVVENDKVEDIVLTLEQPNMETKEGKGLGLNERGEVAKGQTWKMDLHALGVSYKVKRLKQQLFMLERLTGKKHEEDNERVKGFEAFMSLLNRQVDRYNSLQGKIDDLCKRMQEKNSTKMMEQFLEETFMLQRYIVASGQKLIEVQGKIIPSSLVEGIEKQGGFDIERYAESLKTLFRETQRGLEVRISRIVGDLEGALTRDGFNTFRN